MKTECYSWKVSICYVYFLFKIAITLFNLESSQILQIKTYNRLLWHSIIITDIYCLNPAAVRVTNQTQYYRRPSKLVALSSPRPNFISQLLIQRTPIVLDVQHHYYLQLHLICNCFIQMQKTLCQSRLVRPVLSTLDHSTANFGAPELHNLFVMLSLLTG